MQIERNEIAILEYVKDIPIGECFDYDEDIFLKTDTYSVDGSVVFGVNVFSGQEFPFDMHQKVKPLKTKLIVLE